MEDDIQITEEAPDAGGAEAAEASKQGFDPAAFQAQVQEQIQQGISSALAPILERMQPKQTEPAQPQDPFLAALTGHLGDLPEDVQRDYARRRAYGLLADDYEDPKVRAAIEQRQAGARPYELIAQVRRENAELKSKLEELASGLQAKEQDAEFRAQLQADLKSPDSQLKKRYPHLFKRPGKATERLLSLGKEQLAAVLPLAEEIAAESARQARPMPDLPLPGAEYSKTKPTKFLAGNDYDRAIEEMVMSGEVH